MVERARFRLDTFPQRRIGDIPREIGALAGEIELRETVRVAIDEEQPRGTALGQPAHARGAYPGSGAGNEDGRAGEIEIVCHLAGLSARGSLA